MFEGRPFRQQVRDSATMKSTLSEPSTLPVQSEPRAPRSEQRGWLGLRALRRSGQDRPWDYRSRAGLALFCVLMTLVFGAVYAHFLSVSNFFTILLSATSVGIAGIGTMYLLISGNIDLSIGGQY